MKVATCSQRPVVVSCNLNHFDFQIDPYIGCEHSCRYCYVLNQAETDWTQEIQIYGNIREQLGRELERLPPQTIYLGYSTDPYQPLEAEYRQTRQVLELLRERGFSASILTKSDVVLRDIDILQQMPGAAVSVTVSFQHDEDRRRFEDNTRGIGARLTALKRLKRAGIRTGALICPVIPLISDAKTLLATLTDLAETIWIYGLSIEDRSDRNWLNIRDILQTHYSACEKEIESAVFAKDHPFWVQLRKELNEIGRSKAIDLRNHI
jgi:DNA repair photolyase